MSTYTIRIIEGYLPQLSGSYYNMADVPTWLPVGSYVRVYDKGTKYYKKTDFGFEEVDSCPKKWQHLNLYSELQYLPERGYWTDKDGNRHYYDEGIVNTRLYTDSTDGQKKIFERHRYFCNNGGIIRDEYVRNINDTPITGRGIPSDISDSAKAVFCNDKENRNDGYDFTYATCSDLYSLYESAQNKVIKKMIEKIRKDSDTSLGRKLDFIIDHMKDPIGMTQEEIAAVKEPVDDEYEDYYDSLECITDEGFSELYSLATEIGILRYYMDVYDIYSGDDIRIVYYLS